MLRDEATRVSPIAPRAGPEPDAGVARREQEPVGVRPGIRIVEQGYGATLVLRYRNGDVIRSPDHGQRLDGVIAALMRPNTRRDSTAA